MDAGVAARDLQGAGSGKARGSGFAGPWELTWGPDKMLWVTERTGKRITRVNPAGEQKVAVTIDGCSRREGRTG